jgi:hypothetical protein
MSISFQRWQTETGGAAISPRPSEIGEQLIPGKPMKPLFGLQPVLLDEKVNKLIRSLFFSVCLTSSKKLSKFERKIVFLGSRDRRE